MDKRPTVAYNADTQTCSSDSIIFFSCHPTVMCYAVHGNRPGHIVTVVQWSKHMHNSLGHIMPPLIDVSRSAYLLYTVVKYIYTVLTVSKQKDHCLRSTITTCLYKRRSQGLNHHRLRASHMCKPLGYRSPLVYWYYLPCVLQLCKAFTSAIV